MKNPTRYSFWLRNLHWLIAILVIGALSLVELHDLAPRGSALRSGMMYWHMQFGMGVLLLFLPRLLLRTFTRRPAIVPAAPLWQLIPARIMHVALYVLLLVQPVLGLLMVQSGGHPPTFLGLHLPQLVPHDRDLSNQLQDLHVLAGNIFLWLAIVHAAIACWHHWVRRDNTLRRMLYKRG